MVKAKLKSKDGRGKDTFLLGLSEMNVQELKKGRPIIISMKEIDGPDIDVVIHYGTTEQSIAAELLDHVARG